MTSAPTARRADTGGMSAPIAEGHLRVREVQSTQQSRVPACARCPKPYWPRWNRTRLGETRIPDPGPPGTHSHDESGGPINDFYGGYRNWTPHGNHTCGSPHRLDSYYLGGHRGHGSPLILKGPFVSVRGPSGDSWISVFTRMPHSPAG